MNQNRAAISDANIPSPMHRFGKHNAAAKPYA
jgi:hypothetical protein